MQGVDQHDQLRQLFSLSNRHGFKKYYIKIILALLNMATGREDGRLDDQASSHVYVSYGALLYCDER